MWIMQFQMLLTVGIVGILLQSGCITAAESPSERISINDDWRFHKYDSGVDVKLKNTFVYDFETKPVEKYILSEGI
jgi:hypothetical protein